MASLSFLFKTLAGNYQLNKCYSQFQIMSLGKADLLAWINQAAEVDYLSIESLSDGVAYAQLFDAVHPGSVALTRLNLAPKYPQENLRNLRLVQQALKKLKIAQPASFQKMARGVFQDHIVFVQWLFGYVNRNGLENLRYYTAYEKRMRILERQGKGNNEMAQHLRPKLNRYHQQQQWDAGQEEKGWKEHEAAREVDERLGKVVEFLHNLEGNIKELMELNWKMMFQIDRSIEQRNSLHNLLENIDKIAVAEDNSALKSKLQSILHELPPEYQ